jgi:hypothetical protein
MTGCFHKFHAAPFPEGMSSCRTTRGRQLPQGATWMIDVKAIGVTYQGGNSGLNTMLVGKADNEGI